MLTLNPIQRRRLANFRSNKRAFWSLWIFLALFALSLMADIIANDKPLLIRYKSDFYTPIFTFYPETTFGGDFETEADYTDPFIHELIREEGDGWMIWPLIPYSYDTIVYEAQPSPAPPNPPLCAPFRWVGINGPVGIPHWSSADEDGWLMKVCDPANDLSRSGRINFLGTDDQARDVSARVIHGFRSSVAFGLILTLFSSIIGITAGAIQGYFGGWTDLIFQRVIEIWSATPLLYVVLIIASIIAPSFWMLLGILLALTWTSLVGVVRAEFLRARNFEYVQAARALGVSNAKIMFRHLLPNAMVATLTMLPFVLTGAISSLAMLDFLGFGLPPGSASLGELTLQGQNNLQAPWLGITGFLAFAIMLSLLVFIFEGVRDAFDPRKTFR